ncbi:hypothetical protein U9M48_038459 [Paspalum notatum var. saurae]|uniref:Reverse transcriptase domain-containing protein n=1 Tax=Paspalum notatum var. saurae TaxID=547442 RepID=A0AAQ3UGW8_PASNO
MSKPCKSWSVVSWNVRGLGGSEKCTVVRDALLSSKPVIVCLQESKLCDLPKTKAKTFLPPNLSDLSSLNALGTRGGIVTTWDTKLFSLASSLVRRYSLTTTLAISGSAGTVTVTNIYAPSDHRESRAFLAELVEIKPLISGPWLLVGDFNLTRCSSEKNTGSGDPRLRAAFNEAIDQITVVELPLLGCLYTWSNQRATPTLARLDRAFINHEFSAAFPTVSLTPLIRQTSDHKPLLVSISTTIPQSKLFRFENSWLKHPLFLQSVLPAWHEKEWTRDAAARLAASLKLVRAAARNWARRNRAPPALTSNCKFIILLFDCYEEEHLLSLAEIQVRHLARERLHLAAIQHAAYWKQRSKHKAVKEADSNTAYHHAYASQQRRANQITCLEVAGLLHMDHEGVTKAATGYYKTLMGSPGSPEWQFSLDNLYPNQQQAPASLDQPFTEQEAWAAVRGMKHDSAPGPDGFGPAFYKASWQEVKPDIMQMLNAFHEGSIELERINRSYMVLLPKKPRATAVENFRPICLQNCSVKIASKILTTRLQVVISKLIDLDQTGFLKGRSISENFVYATELVQHCHKSKAPTLVLKLDFAKAFDTVQWGSLQEILRARGFSSKWLTWTQDLLSSSLTAVLVNGTPGPWFGCKKGLRQGDPMSPYLFLLVADVLQVLIKNDTAIRHPVNPQLPCSVLQYADDTLIVMRGDTLGVAQLKGLLDQFSLATGLKINYSKSVAIPMHMEQSVAEQCLQILACKQEGFPQSYLGLPLSNSKLRLNAFAPYIAKADRYLAGWQTALLNPMGRLVFVNSVLDSQMVYLMSAMKLDQGLIKQVDRTRRAFLWAGEKTTSGAKCLVNWDAVCDLKTEGGLGVKNLDTLNICLLLKLLHRLHTASCSSWANWVKEHVCLATLTGNLHGEHWKTLRELLPLYRAITDCDVRDGRATSFWFDTWWGPDDLATLYPALHSHAKKKEVSVSAVMEKGLDTMLVPRLTPQASTELITLRSTMDRVTLREGQDRRRCFGANNEDKLHTTMIYQLLQMRQERGTPMPTMVWESRAPPRVQFFGWLVSQERIQCRRNLLRKKIVEDETCCVCGRLAEDTSHILLHCEFAAAFWARIDGHFVSNPSYERFLKQMDRLNQVIHFKGSVTVNVNDNVGPFFQTRKGLRQGDPLSPLLFNIMVDMLKVLITRANLDGQLEGVVTHLVEGGLSILQYADNTILFMNHDLDKALNMKLLLYAFEQASCFKINFHKTHEYVDQYKNLFGCNVDSFPINIPIHFKKLRNCDWKKVEERFEKRLSSFLLMHMMSFFSLPKGVRKKLDYFRSRFYWQGDEQKKKNIDLLSGASYACLRTGLGI